MPNKSSVTELKPRNSCGEKYKLLVKNSSQKPLPPLVVDPLHLQTRIYIIPPPPSFKAREREKVLENSITFSLSLSLSLHILTSVILFACCSYMCIHTYIWAHLLLRAPHICTNILLMKKEGTIRGVEWDWWSGKSAHIRGRERSRNDRKSRGGKAQQIEFKSNKMNSAILKCV